MPRPRPLDAHAIAYRKRIYHDAESICGERDFLEDRRMLDSLWDDHGATGIIDLITEWVCAVDYVVPTNSDSHAVKHLRDLTGAINTSPARSDDVRAEDLMGHAVQHAREQAREHGTSVQEAFRHYMSRAEEYSAYIEEWRGISRLAFQTAHRAQRREPVRDVIATCGPVRRQQWDSLRTGALYVAEFARPVLQAALENHHPLRPMDADMFSTTLPVPSLLSNLQED